MIEEAVQTFGVIARGTSTTIGDCLEIDDFRIRTVFTDDRMVVTEIDLARMTFKMASSRTFITISQRFEVPVIYKANIFFFAIVILCHSNPFTTCTVIPIKPI
jgi:hypothetical protein